MIKKALIAAAALFALSAHAGYAQLANPQGFGGSSGAFTYAANAANDRVFGRVIHQAGGLTANVAGQSVKMAAAYRLAANAPRFAARAVFFNPYVAVGVGIAAWLGGKYIWNEEQKQWEAAENTTGILWRADYNGASYASSWFTSKEAACAGALSAMKSDNPKSFFGSITVVGNYCRYQAKPYSSSPDWYYNNLGLISKENPIVGFKPVSESQFIEDLSNTPMPETVPLELPYPTPLPIEQPSPWINPQPGPNPSNQPYRVPTGEPVPIPNTNPQQYRQPYVEIIPAPTPESPFRVDVRPGETTSTDPNPVENPQPGDETTPTPEEEQSLCEKHPQIAACEKVEVTDKPLPDQPKLYEPKYPDGISGLWNSKLLEIKATPLFNLAPALLPNVSAGSCPSWKIDLSIDGWTNAGLQDVSPPCWVWDVAKLVIIASALLLARRLIFGG